MESTRNWFDNFPYPLRPSELVYDPDFLTEIQPLPLTEAQRGEISAFEEPLFKKLQKLKKIPVSSHTIYPGAFTSERGSRLFSAIYLDRELKDRLVLLATERGVELKNTETRQKFYDAFFDDLAGIVDSSETYQKYIEEGFEFANLSNVLKELGDKSGETVIFKGNVSEPRRLTREEIEEKFFREVNLASIPEQLRTRVSRYSSEWAKEQFAQAFQSSNGNVDEIPNPERIMRLINVGKLTKKIKDLRNFKKELKRIRQKIRDEDSNLAEAKKIVVSCHITIRCIE